MRGPPDANHRRAHGAGEVHVGAVHADHHRETSYNLQLLGEWQPSGHRGDPSVMARPFLKHRCLALAAEEHHLVSTLAEHANQRFGTLQRPNLTLVLRKRSNTNSFSV